MKDKQTPNNFNDILSRSRSEYFENYEHNSWDDIFEDAFQCGWDYRDAEINELKEDIKKRNLSLMEVGLCIRNGYARTDIGKLYLVEKIESILNGDKDE